MKKTLQDLRKDRHLTQKQVANKLNITVVYLSMLENGSRNPSDTLKMKMCKLYECNIEEFFLILKSTKRLKTKERWEYIC